MNIYDIDFSLQNKNLEHPDRRTIKTLDFVDSITDSLQDLRDLLFEDYKTGSSYAAYNNATPYVIYNRVKWTDMSIYELQIPTSTGVDPTGEALSTTNWRKILTYHIGSDERLAYNSQFINLAFSINKYFEVTSAPYFYFVNNNGTGAGFVLWVPIAVYTALGSTNGNRNSRIDQFLKQFTAAGLTYSISTY